MIIGILSLIALGTLAYFAIKLTISVIKNFRKRRNSKIVAANVKDLIKQAAKNPEAGRVSFDDLEDYEGDTVLAEYDDESDEIVQCKLSNDNDAATNNLIRRNNGMVIIED